MLIYDHVARNKVKIFLITALFPLILSALIYLTLFIFFNLDYSAGTTPTPLQSTNQLAIVLIPGVIIVALLWMLYSYMSQGKMILDMSGAHKITKDSHFAIYSMV